MHCVAKRSARERRLDLWHAEVCKVLSNQVRIGILGSLREGEVSVGNLAKVLGLSVATVSRHLGQMRVRGIVQARREGLTVFYRISNPKVIRAFDLMREVMVEHLETVKRGNLSPRDGAEE